MPLDTVTQERSAPDNAPAILGTEPSSVEQYNIDAGEVTIDNLPTLYYVLKGIQAKKVEAHHQGSYTEETSAAIDPLMDTSTMSVADLLEIVKGTTRGTYRSETSSTQTKKEPRTSYALWDSTILPREPLGL